jgi:glycyl-tRNA synthetase beta chain
VTDAVAHALAVAKVRPSPDFEAIATSFKRIRNILRQAQETNKKIAQPYDPAMLHEEAERKLAQEIPQVAEKVESLRASGRYEEALLQISHLRPLVDAFFDKIMVMVEDENLRAQRLGLLAALLEKSSSIADFSLV